MQMFAIALISSINEMSYLIDFNNASGVRWSADENEAIGFEDYSAATQLINTLSSNGIKDLVITALCRQQTIVDRTPCTSIIAEIPSNLWEAFQRTNYSLKDDAESTLFARSLAEWLMGNGATMGDRLLAQQYLKTNPCQ